MNVKRYVAADMRQALKKVREELGPDAVILSNRRVNAGIEILASLEYDPEAFDQFQASNLEAAEPASVNNPANAAAAYSAVSQGPASSGQSQIDAAFANFMSQYQPPAQKTESSADAELMDAMRSEIENLRLLLKDQMGYINDEHQALKRPAEAIIVKRFKQCGIHPGLAVKLARKTASFSTIEEAWQAAIALMARHLPVIGRDLVAGGGIFALIGPTGAGKTTTIAKLAVRFALSHGSENIALVSTDQHRIAAYEQLRTLARIIDVPVCLVDEHNDLDSVLKSLRHKKLVLIDMAGFALNDGLRNQQLKQLVVSKADIKKLLILPCTSQRSVLIDAINAARVCKIDGCVLSKVDEITSLGEVLSLVVEKQLPLAYITNGQTIPDDIELAQATALIEQTCGKHFNTPNITESVEDQLAGGMAKNIKQPLNPTQHSVSARL